MNPPYDQVRTACREGDVEALQRWFPDDPTQWRSPLGESLLHYVVQTPHLPVLDWLLTFPIDVNMPNVYGYTPLMRACCYGQEAMVRRLLDHGAHVHATDSEGWTALHNACSREWVEAVALLLEQGADPEVRNHKGRLPEDLLSVSSPHCATLLNLLDAARLGCGLK
jgi:ankyrin repeat protein